MQTALKTTVCCSSLRVAASAQRRVSGPVARPLGVPCMRPAKAAGRQVAAAASSKPQDFDELLQVAADKFEASNNKPVVIGYLLAAVAAIFVAEWFMHLPLFNILLGFPIQFLGLIVTPYLALRYFVNKDGDIYDDAEFLVGKYSEQLPGLGKK